MNQQLELQPYKDALVRASGVQQIELRPYQEALMTAARDLCRQLHKAPIVVSSATGSGKTVMGTSFISEAYKMGKRAVFVADRIALIDQTSAALDKYGIPHGVMQGDHWRCKPWERVQIASVQTIAKRGWPEADLIIVDECHAMHEAVVARVKQGGATVLGLTATPLTRGLGKVYAGIASGVTTNELIAQGYLVPFRIFAASEPDMVGAKVSAGEWTDNVAAERAMPIVGDCVAEYLKHGDGKKFIAFGCNVAHCDELQRQFEQAGVPTSVYSYKTDDDARAAMVTEFRKPDSYIRGLISVAALSKGFDVSDVEVIIMARPLKSSLAEHIQILGRGLRIHPGKAECIVLDHSGNCMRFWQDMNDFLENGVSELDDGKKKPKPKLVAKPDKEPVKCPSCAHVHKSMPSCPGCGHVYKRVASFEHQPGLLAEVAKAKGGKKLKVEPTKEEKRSFHGQLVAIAKDRNFKPAWADVKFKEKFGCWPENPGQEPVTPTDVVLRWVKSRNIAYAKAKKA